MNSRELMRAAMRSQPTERIPTMPQICRDTAVRLYAEEDGRDWIDGTRFCLENPEANYDYVIRLVRQVGCDGLRLFVLPEPECLKRVGDDLIALDAAGERIGRVDLHGGGWVVPDRPPAPVDTFADARARLAEAEAVYSDARLERLRQVRAQVPDLFVASCADAFTMGPYRALRGPEQAMMDLIERPDYVQAVFQEQVEVSIREHERLLGTGIDAFYIGEPADSASLISPRHFERFCLPAYQQFCRHFRDTDILIYIHICGNSRPILEMMADTGAHCVEPLDPLGGVSVADAKRRIGHRVSLMGGVNTLTLGEGSAEEVRAEAIQKCREGGPHGYILAAGDMVPPQTPLANLQAMVDVATQSLWRE